MLGQFKPGKGLGKDRVPEVGQGGAVMRKWGGTEPNPSLGKLTQMGSPPWGPGASGIPVFCVLPSLKLECEKLVSEKTEMQRHYVMVRRVWGQGWGRGEEVLAAGGSPPASESRLSPPLWGKSLTQPHFPYL